MRLLFIFLFIISSLFSAELENLLKEYESSSKNSLKTLNEKMGYVIVYTKEELELMQYNNLSDVLKEIPANNSNINRFGLNTISLSGSKTDVTGFFRLYINDHEVSAIYNQSPSLTWLQMPVSMIDHIEVYYGEGSFTLGNETGIQFIRVYTKDAKKENGNELYVTQSNKSSNSQSFTHSSLLGNGWAYLLHFTNNNSFSKREYNSSSINNNLNSQYFFMNLNNEKSNIDIGYSKIEKDIYTGYSSDFIPSDGELDSSNFFIHTSRYFLKDNSLKATLSYDINNFTYEEKNKEGMFIVPIIDLSKVGLTMPKEYSEDIKLTKLSSSLSKEFNFDRHEIFTSINFKREEYKTNNREAINFLDNKNEVNQYNDFDRTNVFSFMFQDDYKLFDNLHLIANYKIDKYERAGDALEDETQQLYRVGAIYLLNDYLGFKSFYTKSYIPPTFYNIDFKSKNSEEIDTQKYKYFTFASVFTLGNSKLNIDYYKVNIDDFLYLTPVGFVNIEDRIKTSGVIFDYEYLINKNNKIKLNYYTSNLNTKLSNSNKGGFLKYMGKYENIDYFASLIYKNSYKYLDVDIDDSYNFNLGFIYHHTKNLSFSLKAENLSNKSTASLFNNGIGGENISFEDYERKVTFAVRWLF